MTTPLGCRRERCESRCAIDGTTDAPLAGPGRQAKRWLHLVGALGTGLLVSVLAHLGPRRSRARRVRWAVGLTAGWVLAALDVSVRTCGRPRRGASLIVGNHISWLDILAVTAAVPAVMVAKQEMTAWPLIGPLARRAGAVELDRGSWYSLPATINQITLALRQGLSVQFFPEATTRCGGALGTFHRALFQAAIDAGIPVQPVALRYTDGLQQHSAAPAFVGDEDLLTSLRRVVQMHQPMVDLIWLAPIPGQCVTGVRARDRAILARRAQHAIAGTLDAAVVPTMGAGAGRQPEPAHIPASIPAPMPAPIPASMSAPIPASIPAPMPAPMPG